MRTPIYVVIAALFIGGCTHYHVQPARTPTSSVDRISQPEPERPEPLDLEIGRPSGSQLLIQTNRPAYVAIFEIIPNRGVTLIYPAAVHQQNMLVSGLTWVPLWWSPKRVTFNSDRYIYAVASEEPLQLSGETFTTGYFHRVLGLGIFRAERPYTTMREISRAVVPDVGEEEWAEDVYVLTPTYLSEPYRTARIHCPGGRVFEVPEDMVSRVWCPTRARVVIIDVNQPRSRNYPVARPTRPDSVFGQGGIRVRFEPPRRRGPVTRVVDPTGRDRDDRRWDDRRRARDDRDDRDDRRDRDSRRDERDVRDERDERDEDVEKREKERGGRIKDLIKDVKRQEQEREKQERERQRREAEEARRREAEERKDDREARKDDREDRKDDREDRKDDREDRKDERREDRDARKDEREADRDARKDEREERRDDRRDEARQQGEAREEPKREEPKREEPKREEPKREEPRNDNKRRGNIGNMIEKMKEKEKAEKEKKEKP